jgi:hypothetical protein
VVAARARSPSSPTGSASVSGPRLLLMMTWCPASTASPGDGAADVPASDESPGRHARSNLMPAAVFPAG